MTLLREESAWVDEALARANAARLGEPSTVKQSVWSRVERVPTAQGDFYFKLCDSGARHEAAVTQLVARHVPQLVPTLEACDPARGWLLTRDGGATLRPLIRASKDFSHWRPVLRDYAHLQQSMAPLVPALLAAGTPDRRLHHLADLFELLLENARALRVGKDNGLTQSQLADLRAMRPKVRAVCRALQAHGIGETLNHGDLGDANVFFNNGRCAFFDWGDAVVSHPFFSLRTTLVSLYFSLGLDTGCLELDEVRNFYLACWPGNQQDLRRAFRLALALAPINGALTWWASLNPHSDEAIASHAHAVPSLLQEALGLLSAMLEP